MTKVQKRSTRRLAEIAPTPSMAGRCRALPGAADTGAIEAGSMRGAVLSGDGAADEGATLGAALGAAQQDASPQAIAGATQRHHLQLKSAVSSHSSLASSTPLPHKK